MMKQRIITRMPLTRLWTEQGDLPATRVRWLHKDDIRDLLRRGGVRFAIADMDEPLRWLAAPATFEFWKKEASIRLMDPGGPNVLDDLPGEYGYFASEWTGGEGGPIVLFERHH